jgi:hypothetical protein
LWWRLFPLLQRRCLQQCQRRRQQGLRRQLEQLMQQKSSWQPLLQTMQVQEQLRALS